VARIDDSWHRYGSYEQQRSLPDLQCFVSRRPPCGSGFIPLNLAKALSFSGPFDGTFRAIKKG
jgi:hypothetical protein